MRQSIQTTFKIDIQNSRFAMAFSIPLIKESKFKKKKMITSW